LSSRKSGGPSSDRTIEEKLGRLRRIVSQMGSALVAYSGGVDSTLVVKVAYEELGEWTVAVTAVSASQPEEEREEATRTAREIGVEHVLIESDELDNTDYLANAPDRCYHCKLVRFQGLSAMARERGLAYVVDGSNCDDLGEHRPGMRAAQELGVRSPLLEAGMTKADIRAASRKLGIGVWNKPSGACLATRIPYGTRITRDMLRRVGEAESFLRRLGVGQVRVRHHGSIARIEVEPESVALAVANRSQIANRLRELGFTYVTLDLAGYRSGSMNEALEDENG
jgi:uncharacterized protein